MAIKLTPGETKLLSLGWACIDSPPKASATFRARTALSYTRDRTLLMSIPQVDSKKLAELGGYKTPASANTCWYTLKNKILLQDGKAASATTLTPAEHKLLVLAWQCCDTVPKVDSKKLAELGGYKTPASANTCWYNLKKKLLSPIDAGGTVTTVDPANTSAKKRANDSTSRDGPTEKKQRGRPKKVVMGKEPTKVGTSVEGAEESDDDELEVVKPKSSFMAVQVKRVQDDVEEAGDESKEAIDEVKREVEAEEVGRDFFDSVMAFGAAEA